MERVDRAVRVRIVGTGSALPGRLVRTEELVERTRPGRDPADMIARTGIDTRWWHDPATDNVTSVSVTALRAACADAGIDPRSLRRVILANSHGGDHQLPPTANKVIAALDLHETCDAFDLNNACVGFLSALDLGARSVATGLYPVAVVATELASRLVSPADPRPYMIMGDGAGAVVLGPSAGGSAIVGSWLANDGRRGDRVTMGPANGALTFAASKDTIGDDVIDSMRIAIDGALARANLTMHDVRWALLHQANGVLYEKTCAAFGLAPDRVVPLVREVGSIGVASVPLSLDVLARSGRLGPGEHVLMAAVGSGLAYGATVYRTAA